MEVIFTDSFFDSLKRINSPWTKIRHFFIDIKYGIENLFKWFKVVWNDRSWDHEYIFVMLRHKLLLQADYQRDWGISVDANLYAKQMYFCVKILDRLIADDYMLPEYRKNLESRSFWEEITDEDRMLIDKNMQYEKHWNDRDLKLLFSCMEKHIQSWWD